MKKIAILRDHFQTITYSKEDWNILDQKRKQAKTLMQIFVKEGLEPYLYGSVARGDVHMDSDIDIFFAETISPYKIEIILEKNGFKNYYREIIMATPKDSLKFYIHLSELESITIPITRYEKISLEFYNFGGKINLEQLENDIRVPGIDKRLVLIEPILEGHKESSVLDHEHLAMRKVNVGIDIIKEREKVLLKREKHGRTGVFLKRELRKEEPFEEVLKKLARQKSIVRNKLIQK